VISVLVSSRSSLDGKAYFSFFFPPLFFLLFRGVIAIPGPKDGFWLYFIGPWVGGLVGGLFYILLLGNHFQDGSRKPEKKQKIKN
jgi:hypothetical protein